MIEKFLREGNCNYENLLQQNLAKVDIDTFEQYLLKLLTQSYGGSELLSNCDATSSRGKIAQNNLFPSEAAFDKLIRPLKPRMGLQNKFSNASFTTNYTALQTQHVQLLRERNQQKNMDRCVSASTK